MANKEWRPQNPFVDVIPPPDVTLGRSATYLKGKHDGFDCGASAMLKALIKWLFEPCIEHPQDDDINDLWYFTRRRDCPKCMEQLKGEK